MQGVGSSSLSVSTRPVRLMDKPNAFEALIVRSNRTQVTNAVSSNGRRADSESVNLRSSRSVATMRDRLKVGQWTLTPSI